MLEENRYIEIGKNARNYVEQNHEVSKIMECYKNYFVGAI